LRIDICGMRASSASNVSSGTDTPTGGYTFFLFAEDCWQMIVCKYSEPGNATERAMACQLR
jgi:hypothetical protein